MDDRIRQVLDHIEDHLFSRLALEDLAEVACMSPGHFHRTFRQATGRTPFQFIGEIKMKKAFQLLVSGDRTVHELSLQFGYNDYETFSRAFKKYHGMAPDDIKAIALKIQGELEIGPEGLIIETVELEKLEDIKDAMEQLTDRLKVLLAEHGLSKKDLDEARVISAMPKPSGTAGNKSIVKNKYVIAEEPKIWRELLKRIDHGN